ncbi:hypothetical protein TrLO_g2617 [Triparma laevis f. longispina]|uniref:Uncharacterized protein n=1 Tax=Triparma laevis f. longispina TaxID=1714387 RepID=A0A9W7KX56_9STRA|nr:hypothetical protein TrLO_g2617 [Triparma laevis f. longispina]
MQQKIKDFRDEKNLIKGELDEVEEKLYNFESKSDKEKRELKREYNAQLEKQEETLRGKIEVIAKEKKEAEKHWHDSKAKAEALQKDLERDGAGGCEDYC